MKKETASGCFLFLPEDKCKIRAGKDGVHMKNSGNFQIFSE